MRARAHTHTHMRARLSDVCSTLSLVGPYYAVSRVFGIIFAYLFQYLNLHVRRSREDTCSVAKTVSCVCRLETRHLMDGLKDVLGKIRFL